MPPASEAEKVAGALNQAKGKNAWKKGGGGDPPPKWCSLYKTVTYSDAECHKQQELKSQRPAQANFTNVRSARLAQDYESDTPTFGFSYSAVGESAAAAGAAASAKPAAAAETVIHLGPPPSEMLKKQRESTPGPFGAFGETYMTASNTLTSPASDPSAGSQITVMVDSGVSGHFLDPFLIPGLRGFMSDYCSLDVPHKIVTVGQYVFDGMKGTVRGHVNVSGHKRLVAFSAIVVPGLGKKLFSVAMSLATGVVTVFDSVRSRLERGNVVLPMDRLGDDRTLYSFSIDLVHDSAGAAMRAESADLWHRRMGHINSKSMAVLRGVPDNGVEYRGCGGM